MKAFVSKCRSMVAKRRPRVAVTVAVADVHACPICLVDCPRETLYTAPCQHAFCTPCLEAMVMTNHASPCVPCPLCRAPFEYMKERVPFNRALYPSKVDFAFVEDRFDRNVLYTAYQTICRENGWAYLYQYRDEAGHGFIFSGDKTIQRLMMKIEDNYPVHSGVSMGFTMRRMHKLAQVGYAAYAAHYWQHAPVLA